MVDSLQWETIHFIEEVDENDKPEITEYTYRAKIKGGWIIRNITIYHDVTPIQRTESCCFVPDF